MKNLTIVRHAESALQDAQYLDKNRPLTKNGRNDALLMSQRIRDTGIKPSKILSSSATRAWETALIIAKTIKYSENLLTKDDRLYLADIHNLVCIIEEQNEDVNNLMIIGHNPGLIELINLLSIKKIANLSTSGAVSLNINTDDWNLITLTNKNSEHRFLLDH
jgi:phosphohistidine phosphatase